MANRRHHHAYRCNECVRRRNGQRRLREIEDAQPSGSIQYELERDHPAIYADWRDMERALCQTDHGAGAAGPSAQPADLGQPPDDFAEEQQHQQDQAASRAAEERLSEQEWELGAEPNSDLPTDPVFVESSARNRICTCTPDDTPCAYCQSSGNTGPQRAALKRLLAPIALTLIPIAAIVGISLVSYWLLRDPTDASSQAAVATPDLEATIIAAVDRAITRAAPTPTASSNDLDPAEHSAEQQEVETPLPGNTPIPAPEHLRPSMCSYCDTTDEGLGQYVQWEGDPTVSKTGWLLLSALIDERADFFGENLASCTSNVSLSDSSEAFYGWVISRNRAKQCGNQPADWVSSSYAFENNRLSLGVQLDAAAATHPGLEVCLWTGGATKNETRLIDCRPVRQPRPTE